MANFDLRPDADSRAGDGQLYNSEQVAPDEFYNCTWEALRQTARVFGFAGFDDEELRQVANALYARGAYSKGERWETNIGVAQRTWPELAAGMWAEYPDDIVAAIRGYGEQGFRVHCGFWCDSAANVPPIGVVSYSHALLSLWGDDGGIGWVNPEPHPDTYLSDDQVRALYDGGGILVFKHPIGGADMSAETEAMLKRIHDSWFGIPLVTPPLPTDGRAANVGDLVVGISRVIGVDPADPTAATLAQHVAHAEQEAADLAAQLTAGLTGLISGLEQLVAAVKAEADLAPALEALAGHVNSVQAGVEELLKHRTGGNLA